MAYGQLALILRDDRIFYAGTQWQFQASYGSVPGEDNIHLSPEGYLHLGQSVGTYLGAALLGNDEDPIVIASVQADTANSLLVTFDGVEGRLVSEDRIFTGNPGLAAPGFFGFSLISLDGTDASALTGAIITDADHVRLTFDSPLEGTYRLSLGVHDQDLSDAFRDTAFESYNGTTLRDAEVTGGMVLPDGYEDDVLDVFRVRAGAVLRFPDRSFLTRPDISFVLIVDSHALVRIRARRKPSPSRSRVLLSFNGIGHHMGGMDVQRPEFFTAGNSFDNILFISDLTRSWGNPLDLGEILAGLAAYVDGRQVFALGNSLGGFLPSWPHGTCLWRRLPLSFRSSESIQALSVKKRAARIHQRNRRVARPFAGRTIQPDHTILHFIERECRAQPPLAALSGSAQHHAHGSETIQS